MVKLSETPMRHWMLIGSACAFMLFAGCDEDDPMTPPPDSPTVSTGGVLSIGRQGAVVEGTVDPRGTDSTYWFEFGPSVSYGSATDEFPAPAMPAGPRSVTASLSGLSPATTYHFRLVARNAGGTVQGDDATLLTLDPNQPPETQVTAAGTDTLGTTVRWFVAWNGSDADGVVARYELRVADHGPDGALDPPDSLGVPWVSTVVTDTMITWEDGLGSRTFFVRAVDDQEAPDPTPASISVEAATK